MTRRTNQGGEAKSRLKPNCIVPTRRSTSRATNKAKPISSLRGGPEKGRLMPIDRMPGHEQSGASPQQEPTNNVRRSRATPLLNPIPNAPGTNNGTEEATTALKPTQCLPDLCHQLQVLQRQRVTAQRTRIMIENRLAANVAVMSGYSAGLDEDGRKAKFDAARETIKRIRDGEQNGETDSASSLVSAVSAALAPFDEMETAFEKAMVKLAEQLPVAAWCKQPEQRGFGIKSLAVIVGEAGDLSLYANPGKLWKRLGCAPIEHDGKMSMPSTWRRVGVLSAAEWEAAGYSPRRRSVAYVIGENLLKLNKGPYRARYDESKAKMAEAHPDDNDYPPLRCHRHGLLLAAKLLLKNLWIAWRGPIQLDGQSADRLRFPASA